MFGKKNTLDEDVCNIIKKNMYYIPECTKNVAELKNVTEIEAENIVKTHVEAMRKKYGTRINNTVSKQTDSKRSIVSCPKCGSTSITTTNKKLSASRGVAGTAVGGLVGNVPGAVAGAVVGSLSSKKIYNVCMNCGHRWKP